jgi:hypothetical protein
LLSPEQIESIGKGVPMEDGFKVPGQKIGTATIIVDQAEKAV